MRIALAHRFFATRRGGIESWLAGFAGAAVAVHDVTVFCAEDGAGRSEEDCGGIRVVRHPDAVLRGIGRWTFPDIEVHRLARWFTDYLKTHEPFDVYIARHPSYALALARATPAPLPVLFVQATALGDYERIRLSNRRWRRLYEPVLWRFDRTERAAMERALRVVALSRSRLDSVLTYHRPRLARAPMVIPPGVDLDRFTIPTQEEKSSLRQAMGLGLDTVLIASVGRFTPEKNFGFLLDVVARLPKGVHVAIVGEGPLHAELEAKKSDLGLGERVQFLPGSCHVANVLKAADLFALFSTYEGFGQVFLEAMASGLPCVALREGQDLLAIATPEIIDPGRDGLLTVGDPSGAASAISELIANRAWLREMSRAAREKALRYSWQACVECTIRAAQPWVREPVQTGDRDGHGILPGCRMNWHAGQKGDCRASHGETVELGLVEIGGGIP